MMIGEQTFPVGPEANEQRLDVCLTECMPE